MARPEHINAQSSSDTGSRGVSPHINSPNVISMGCRLNAFEGEAMRRLGAEAGLGDAIVVNSCAVTNEAVRQTRQTIRKSRRQSPSAKIIVTGCAAQIDPASFAKMPEVDAVLGNHEKLDAREWRALSSAEGRGEPVVSVNDIMAVRETAGHLIDGYGDRARAFLQIQNGCDHRCTFCIIPFGRGNSRSTPIETAVEQAQRLVASGHREIVLTGVDITSYGADLDGAPTLGTLIGALLDGVPDLARLRLSSIDSAEIDKALFELIIGEPRIAPHLHLSLQAGDDMILKRMKRRHTRTQAIEFCATVRKARPEIAFGADIIAGFPTESEEMFQQSLNLVDEAGLNYLHVFPFSPREGTPAARMPQLDRAIIKTRAERLREKGARATEQFLDKLIGATDTAIVESGGRARFGNFAQAKLDGLAKTENLADAVNPDGAHPLVVGDLVALRVTGRDGALLVAERV